MTWIKLSEKPHSCKPPEEPAYTDTDLFTRCAVGSWDDIWQCDECQKYWTPKPSLFPFHSYWAELSGWKLRRRLRRVEL